ncbi:hypothetical protein BLA13014_04428 [Burkholderia aenigmatica]|uniref:Uncharacterized protein n=1 Tax=Burkholderia aenigmatica TaxID=2015348 RepID=A0A6P2NJS8_9BURK|nr:MULTISPECIES: hypothetical protein [Burkholderia]VWB94912.1 hypothetical protein BLA13014_04428 [Burkholderia aenigmatica]
MSEKTYEVLEPVRIHRKSRAVGAFVDAHPDHVDDLVRSGVLREVADADGNRAAGDGSQLEADANSGTAMDASQSSTSTGGEGAPQGGEGTKEPVSEAAKSPVVPPITKSAKTSSTRPAAKRGAAAKGRK